MNKFFTPVALRLVLVAMIGFGVVAPASPALAGTGQGGGNCITKSDTTDPDVFARVQFLFDVFELLLP